MTWETIKARPALTVFVAALAIRLFYLAFFTQPPVQFDARQYTAVAAAAPLAVSHPSLWNDTTARESISFSRVINDLVDDEQILWSPYDPPTYGQAVDWLFFSGPTYPAFLSTIYHATPRHDFWVVRIMQAIVDSLTAVLLLLVMQRLISPLGGLIAAFGWVLYGPAIMKTGELLTETLSVFLTVAMVWTLIRAHENQSRRWLAAAGAICAILAMAKASTAVMIVPIIAVWLWVNRRKSMRPRIAIALLGSTWLLVMLPWIFLIYHRFGTFAVRDPSYGDANFRQANILETEGYNVDKAPTDFWTYPVWREIKNRPVEYARLYLQKFRRLWWRACDDYRLGFPFGVTGVQWVHKLTILLAAVGVLVWTRRAGPPAWFAIAVIVYFAGLHTLMHVVSRYNMLAMPFVIGAAVWGVAWMTEPAKPGGLARIARLLVIIGACAIGITCAKPTTWMLIPGVSSRMAVALFWGFALAVVLLAAYLALSMRRERVSTQLALTAAVGGGIALVLLGWATTREGYAEWAAYLDRPGMEIRRHIELPGDVIHQDIKLANLLIDGVVAHDASFKVVLSIDHARYVFPDSFFVIDESFYPKPQYRAFMRMNGDRAANVRCWSRNIIEGPLLDSIIGDGVVDVSIAVEGNPEVEGHLAVFGDLPPDSPGVFTGPALQASSIERYYEGRDPRLWESFSREVTSEKCEFIVDGKSKTDDLSNCFGRQAGQYRIILRLLLADDRALYY